LAACQHTQGGGGLTQPEKPEVQAMLREAAAMQASGDESGAKASYQAALQASQSGVHAHLALAGILMKEANYAAAEEILAQAAKRQPQSLEVLQQQGRIALMQGQAETALQVAEKGIKLSPQD